FTDLSRAEGVELLVPDSGKEMKEKVPEPLENYLPPEVVAKKAAVSKLTDVYSLGAMFFEILSGESVSELDEISIDRILELFQYKNQLIPPRVAEVVFWAIHPEPFSRSQRVDEIIVGLKECLSVSQEEVSAAEIVQAEEQEDSQAIIDSLLFRVVSGYRIQDFLGEGLQGFVFRGIHEKTGSEAAIKITHRIKEGFETADRLLRRSFRLIKTLDHPNVAKVFDLGYIGNKEYMYVVMELVEGRRLDKMDLDLSQMDRGDIREVLDLTLAICEGIHAAHTMEYIDEDGEMVYGVMHGNLKTRKIIVSDENSPKVIDFMFGELLESPDVVISTPKDIKSKHDDRPEDYLPPEVVWQGHKVNKRTDVYALGAIFYELFSGRPLGIHHPRTDDTVHKILRQRNARTSRQLSKALFKAIHPEPYLRYNTVREFMKDILKNMPLPKRLLYAFWDQ
ncbi:serine/threonine-protein kinase, partial [bacterium]|nr:serine/threonine-protein kinase [bacterium]